MSYSLKIRSCDVRKKTFSAKELIDKAFIISSTTNVIERLKDSPKTQQVLELSKVKSQWNHRIQSQKALIQKKNLWKKN